MDKLQIIKQVSASDLLQEEPMTAPSDAPKLGKCPWILERGEEKGDVCNKTTFDGEKYCNAHQISNARREAKRLKRQKEDNTFNSESSSEISVVIKSSGAEPTVEIKETPAKLHVKADVPIIDVFPPKIEIPVQKPVEPTKFCIKESISENDILTIMKNFSIAIVNLTEILKK